jgi:RHS repeat-associated protein
MRSNGVVQERYAYRAYGKLSTLSSSFSGPLLADVDFAHAFTGQHRETTTHLYRFRTRNQHSSLGIFVSRDPLLYVDGNNSYSYVRNNPLRNTDPSGRQVPILVPRLCVPRVGPQLRIYVPPPRPFIPPPPIPIMPAPPTAGGDSKPVPGPSNFPPERPAPDWWDPSAQDLPPPGKCTEIEYIMLRDAKKAACDTDPRPEACGFLGWTCDDYSDYEKKWRDCAKAREKIMKQCFGGGNKTHRDQEYEARLRAWECERLWIKWCWEPPPDIGPLIACECIASTSISS